MKAGPRGWSTRKTLVDDDVPQLLAKSPLQPEGSDEQDIMTISNAFILDKRDGPINKRRYRERKKGKENKYRVTCI